MSVTASGSMSLPKANLKTLLAATTAFQTWVSASDAAGAAAHIGLVAIDPDADKSFRLQVPLALVRDTSPLDERWPKNVPYATAGTLEIVFMDAVATANAGSHADAMLAFQNTVGAVLTAMQQLSQSGGYLILQELTIADGPRRAHPDTRASQGDFMEIVVRVRWGVQLP